LSWPVRVRPEAELDMLLVARWYETQRKGLGTEFIDEIARLVASLPKNALLYPERSKGLRRIFARRFPYAMSFRLQGESVVVLSVFHMRRNRPDEA
jgi:plasmid stabilization system protein ParE